jgi:hypothetical protein
MGRIKRGGYIFEFWKGDHHPSHVHVYKDNKPVAKIQLDPVKVLDGEVNIKVFYIIRDLIKEGKL